MILKALESMFFWGKLCAIAAVILLVLLKVLVYKKKDFENLGKAFLIAFAAFLIGLTIPQFLKGYIEVGQEALIFSGAVLCVAAMVAAKLICSPSLIKLVLIGLVYLTLYVFAFAALFFLMFCGG